MNLLRVLGHPPASTPCPHEASWSVVPFLPIRPAWVNISCSQGAYTHAILFHPSCVYSCHSLCLKSLPSCLLPSLLSLSLSLSIYWSCSHVVKKKKPNSQKLQRDKRAHSKKQGFSPLTSTPVSCISFWRHFMYQWAQMCMYLLWNTHGHCPHCSMPPSYNFLVFGYSYMAVAVDLPYLGKGCLVKHLMAVP